MTSASKSVALVIGLCSHGVAMTRALHKQGIKVYAFESDRSLPGVSTNTAEIHFIEGINSDSLVNDLLEFREHIASDISIVLFPTNDNNVRILAENIDQLRGQFLLSWQGCSELVLDLLKKNNIEKRCLQTGIRYPSSKVIDSAEQLVEFKDSDYPVLIKPVTPQSSFKALKCENFEELSSAINRYQADMPILLQPWISGTDRDLYFGALYLDNGSVISEMVGNKVESYPPAMGQTTVAVTCENDEVLRLTKAFFDGLNMSGPVSLELKKDEAGRYWVIEPTVGRTDFWFDLCVKAGQNLLHTEHLHCTGQVYPQKNKVLPVIWFDSEKDILACVRNAKLYLPLSRNAYRPTFSYFDLSDVWPFLKSCKTLLLKVKHRLLSSRKGVPAITTLQYQTYFEFDTLPEDAKALLSLTFQDSIFLGEDWYRNFTTQVIKKPDVARYIVFKNTNDEVTTVIPLWFKTDRRWLLKRRWVTSLTNYYSPIYDLNRHPERISSQDAMLQLVSYLESEKLNWDIADFSPLFEVSKNGLMTSAQSLGLSAFSYLMSQNLYESNITSFESYMALRPSKLKNTIIRKTRKLSKEFQWNIEMYSSPTEVSAAINQYHEVYNNSWKVNEPFPQFVSGLAEKGALNGWTRLGVLSVEGKPVAAQLWLVNRKTANIYKLAYDKKFHAYSPGTILTEHIAKHVINLDHVTTIDFLTGDDSYKNDWMQSSRPLYGVQLCGNHSLIGKISRLRNYISGIKKKWSQL